MLIIQVQNLLSIKYTNNLKFNVQYFQLVYIIGRRYQTLYELSSIHLVIHSKGLLSSLPVRFWHQHYNVSPLPFFVL